MAWKVTWGTTTENDGIKQLYILDSLEASSNLIYEGLKIIELSYRGENTNQVGGYHFSYRNLSGNDRLSAYYSDTLTIALLRLADFRTINPFLNP